MEITFILKSGARRTVNYKSGDSVSHVAEINNIPIGNACKGFGVCGSCNVIVEIMFDKLPEIADHENDTLDAVTAATPTSRLACQLILDENTDCIIVRIP